MEARASSLGALAGSLGGQSAPSPPAQRLEVTADVDAAADDPDPDPPASGSRAARLRSLFLYGSAVPPPAPDIVTAEAGEVVHPTVEAVPIAACDSVSVRDGELS